jgi:hypothetical protein
VEGKIILQGIEKEFYALKLIPYMTQLKKQARGRDLIKGLLETV